MKYSNELGIDEVIDELNNESSRNQVIAKANQTFGF